MANIMITEVCNLKCPYCFADEFVNKKKNEISVANFKKALDFILCGNNTKVGLIGGEPTLHSKFKELLQIVIDEPRVKECVIYTNGLEIEPFLNELAHEKFKLLINCNSPTDMGEHRFAALYKNLDEMIRRRYMQHKITLGINMYRPDFEYDYFVFLLKKYQFRSARVSITVPGEADSAQPAFAFFHAIKPRMLAFFEALLDLGIEPFYDCNKMPGCIMGDAIKELAAKRGDDPKNNSSRSIFNAEVRCSPVIDITPDLQAVRCFGLSEHTKVSIADFRNGEELFHYYLNTVDAFAYNTASTQNCSHCYDRITRHCMGGCLVYKFDKIRALQQRCKELLD